MLHPEFHSSKWTDQEIGYAMGRGIPVSSIRLGENPYGFIGRIPAFQGIKKEPEELARELFDAYRKNKKSKKRMSEVLVTQFVQSSSFAEAKMHIRHLKS